MVVIWVIMWWMWFKFIHQDEEKLFRTNQLCGVLIRSLKNNKNFKQTLPLFEDVLNTVLKYGDLQMVTQILGLMNYLKIKKNSTIDNIFFMAIRKYREYLKKKEESKVEGIPTKISDMIANMEKQKLSQRMFKRWEKSLDYSHPDTLQEKSTFLRRTFKCFKVRFLYNKLRTFIILW